MRSRLKCYARAINQRFIHDRLHVVKPSDRRLCAKLTIGKQLAELLLISNLHVSRFELSAQRPQIDSMRGRQRAHHKSTIRLYHDRLDYMLSGNVFGRGEILCSVRGGVLR